MAKPISQLTESTSVINTDLVEISKDVGGGNYESKKVQATNLLSDVTLNSPLKFNTNPVIGTYTEGKLYYDYIWKTFAMEVNGGSTLQVGQEEYRYVYNNSGIEIPDGKAVYTTGAYTSGTPNVVTVSLAQANTFTSSVVLGVATNAISNGSYGFVTVRGTVNNIKTDYPTWASGDVLYLSGTVAGDLTNVLPDDPHLHVRIGRVITLGSSAGSINVRILVNTRLQDLSDAKQVDPNDGDTIVREGNTWVYRPPSVSAGPGVCIYLDNTPSYDAYESLVRSPVTTTPTQTSSVTVLNTTALIKGFIYPLAQNRTKLDGGTWKFNTFAYIDSSSQESYIVIGVYRVIYNGGIVTITGSGTNLRTATLSGYSGTPFVSGDANSDMTLSGYIQANSGTFQIATFTNEYTVDIVVPTGFVNPVDPESYSVHKYLFQTITPEINQTGTATLYTSETVQGEFLYDLTDTTAFRYFGRTNSNSNKTIYIEYNGVGSYSFAETPVSVRHNELSGLNLNDYKHLTAAEYAGEGTGIFVKDTSPTITMPTLDNPTITTPVVDTALTLKEVTTPSNPSSGYLKTYYKSDEQLYKLNSSGVESLVAGGRAVIIDAQKSMLTTNTYLNGTDGVPMNVVPFIIPFDSSLVSMSASTDGSFTWTAEIHVNSVLKTNAILSISSADSGYSSSFATVTTFGAGDKVMLYCNGSGIEKPRISVFFRKI